MGNHCRVFAFIYHGIFFISSLLADNVLDEVVVVREGTSVTLPCFDSPPTSSVRVTWTMTSMSENGWSYRLSVNWNHGRTDELKSNVFRGMTFEISKNASLIFTATPSTLGRYSCATERDNQKLQEKTVLLALIKLMVRPTPPVEEDRTLRLTAEVSPSFVAAWGTWVSPSGEQLYTEINPATGSLLSKLPRITRKDNGIYTCRFRVHGNSGPSVIEHRVNVTVNVKAVFSFTDVKYGAPRSVAVLSHSLITLTCPPVLGDYVILHWQHPDSDTIEYIFQFDRWRQSYVNKTKLHLSLVDPVSLAAAGNFTFLLSPALKEGGIYMCEVFEDDKAFSQTNTLSVLHGYTKSSLTSLDLSCMYTEQSHIKALKWSHVQNSTKQNKSRFLPTKSVLGRVTTSIPRPVTPETAGLYACTLYLNNGYMVQYLVTVTMAATGTTVVPGAVLPPAAEDVSTSSYVPTLSFLLFLIPMSALAVGVLLWRQGYCISRRSVEQSLSHHSGEVENIYENPDDLRQTPPQGAVYMDLKPTSQMDVYKELDRYNQCIQ